MNSALSLLSDALVYAGLPLGLWISFRILSYPDLAIEQLFVLGGVIYARAVTGRWPLMSTVALLLLTGIALALICSILRVKYRIHPVLISLALSYAYYSISLVILGGPNLYVSNSSVPSLRTALLVATAVLLIGAAGLYASSRTLGGLRVIAVGSNISLASRTGLQPTLWHAVGLTASFMFVLASGCLFTWRSNSIDVTSGTGLLLVSVFVVVLARALQKRVHTVKNLTALLTLLTVYLAFIDIALRVGLPPQWLRGSNAAALLALILLLPREREKILAI